MLNNLFQKCYLKIKTKTNVEILRKSTVLILFDRGRDRQLDEIKLQGLDPCWKKILATGSLSILIEDPWCRA